MNETTERHYLPLRPTLFLGVRRAFGVAGIAVSFLSPTPRSKSLATRFAASLLPMFVSTGLAVDRTLRPANGSARSDPAIDERPRPRDSTPFRGPEGMRWVRGRNLVARIWEKASKCNFALDERTAAVCAPACRSSSWVEVRLIKVGYAEPGRTYQGLQSFQTFRDLVFFRIRNTTLRP